MRITNGMMLGNSLTNINANKTTLDILNTQMSTQKKIARPSDDPVVAIRALRLRSNLNELNQYYEKNITDANSLLEVTEEALTNMRDIVKDVYNGCVQGSNGTLTAQDRSAIAENFQALKEQFYAEGNADYAGRNLFTGYKTDKDLTFGSDDSTASYSITETFSAEDVEAVTCISNGLVLDKNNPAAVAAADMPASSTIYRMRLAYSGLDALAGGTGSLTYTDNDGNIQTVAVTGYESASDEAYLATPAGGISYIAETGELILGEEINRNLRVLEKPDSISFTYDKTGFDKGDLRPEHYFDCQDKTDSGNVIPYTKEAQSVEYTINFNQKLKVNTEGSDVLTHSLGRDIDEILESINNVTAAEKKAADIKSMLEDPQYEGSRQALASMLEAAEKELTLKSDRMQKLFEAGQTKFQNHETDINLQITDVGSRVNRLELTQSRLAAQQTSFEKLQSENENLELSDVLIQYTAAKNSYEASLTAASRIVQKSLLDFL